MKKSILIILSVMSFCSMYAQNPILKIEGGNIQGVSSQDGKAIIYKGVPYASPPVGDLRWKDPQPVKPWEGVKVADTFAPAALQMPHNKSMRTQVNKFGDVDYIKEFYENGDPQYSEDCLYLNVWQPKGAKKGDKLPVAFWIHGGAFMAGYGYENEFDGEAYAKRGVILVTINYRLGILGYLAHPELSNENAKHVSGNYGLLDQIKALQWVHDNISQFGGDPNKITVFGQSAGAMSTRDLLCSPLTKGLIARAIIQSGGGLGNKNGLQISSLADYEKIGEKIFNGKTLKDMRQMSYNELMQLMMKYCQENQTWLMLSPNIDGYALNCDLSAGVSNKTIPHIPYMMGCTLDDMDFTKIGMGITDFSLSLKQNGYEPAYIYEFVRRLPGDVSGAFHSSELWYMFGTLKRCWRPMTDADYKLSDKMLDYWTNFMKTGNPNGKGLPTWKPCTTGMNEVINLDIK
jgi:para-nitrobenzyl esterase